MIKISNKEFEMFSDYIRENYGIYLKEEKKTLVINRLYNEFVNSNCKTLKQYLEYILSDKSGEALNILINKITTNYTFFMREAEHFYFFRDKVLPYLLSTVKDKDLRIWSAGCSTGQEPYTIAMIIDDYLKEDKKLWDTKILATDISSKVLNEAMEGIYSKDQIKLLPSQWRLSYFKRIDNENYMIVDNIKKEVIFRKFNLMNKVFPFRKKFHVIFCRNVMIYFDSKTRTELINKFYDILEYGGYLFIGLTESIQRNESKFQYVMPSVYRKI